MLHNLIYDHEDRLRTVWRLTIAFLGVVLLYFAAGVILGIMLIGYALLGGDVKGINSGLDTSLWWVFVLPILPTVFLHTIFILLCRKFLDHRPLRSIGFEKPGWSLFNSVSGGLLWGALPIILSVAILTWCGRLELTAGKGLLPPLLLLPLLVLAAFNEELIFRGYFYRNFLDIHRPLAGLIISSLLFWLVHSLNAHVWSSPLAAVNLFGAGVLLALAYRLAGNIWFPTALHFSWNYVQGPVFGIPVSGNELPGFFESTITPNSYHWLTGGKFGLEASILVTICEVLVIALFGFLIRKRASA